MFDIDISDDSIRNGDHNVCEFQFSYLFRLCMRHVLTLRANSWFLWADFDCAESCANGSVLTSEVVLPGENANISDVVDHHNDEDDWQNGVATEEPVPNQLEHSYNNVIEEFLNHSIDDREDSISGHVYFERIK